MNCTNPSPGSHSPFTAIRRRPFEMDSRAGQEYLAPLLGFHLQRQRLSRFIKSLPSVLAWHGQGELHTAIVVHPTKANRADIQQYPTIILSQTQPPRHPAGGPTAYLQYVRHITSTPGPATSNSASALANARIPEDGAADFTAGYADYLQAPLQPLMDDLGSATYDVFERDPVKYRQYEEAIFLALSDLPQDKRQ